MSGADHLPVYLSCLADPASNNSTEDHISRILDSESDYVLNTISTLAPLGDPLRSPLFAGYEPPSSYFLHVDTDSTVPGAITTPAAATTGFAAAHGGVVSVLNPPHFSLAHSHSEQQQNSNHSDSTNSPRSPLSATADYDLDGNSSISGSSHSGSSSAETSPLPALDRVELDNSTMDMEHDHDHDHDPLQHHQPMLCDNEDTSAANLHYQYTAALLHHEAKISRNVTGSADSSSSSSSSAASGLGSESDSSASPVPSGSPSSGNSSGNFSTLVKMELPNGQSSFPSVSLPLSMQSSPLAATGSAAAGGNGGENDTFRELIKEQTVKKQRLARKAELARMSRKRKKTRLTELEGEVAQLKEELERERKQRKIAADNLVAVQSQLRVNQALAAEQDLSTALSDTALMEENKQLHESLRKVMGAAPTAANATAGAQQMYQAEVQRLVTDLVQVVNRKQSNTVQQVRPLQKQLTATLQLRFIEWALSQKEAFYADQSGLWNSLFVREVGLSQDQLSSIILLRQAIQQQKQIAAEMQSSFVKFNAAVAAYAQHSSANVDKFVSMFTPEQLAKFFAWVETYGSVCVQINI